MFGEVAQENADLEVVDIFTNIGGRNTEFCLLVAESFACYQKLR